MPSSFGRNESKLSLRILTSRHKNNSEQSDTELLLFSLGWTEQKNVRSFSNALLNYLLLFTYFHNLCCINFLTNTFWLCIAYNLYCFKTYFNEQPPRLPDTLGSKAQALARYRAESHQERWSDEYI
jgi:hypothetical protein